MSSRALIRSKVDGYVPRTQHLNLRIVSVNPPTPISPGILALPTFHLAYCPFTRHIGYTPITPSILAIPPLHPAYWLYPHYIQHIGYTPLAPGMLAIPLFHTRMLEGPICMWWLKRIGAETVLVRKQRIGAATCVCRVYFCSLQGTTYTNCQEQLTQVDNTLEQAKGESVSAKSEPRNAQP